MLFFLGTMQVKNGVRSVCNKYTWIVRINKMETRYSIIMTRSFSREHLLGCKQFLPKLCYPADFSRPLILESRIISFCVNKSQRERETKNYSSTNDQSPMQRSTDSRVYRWRQPRPVSLAAGSPLQIIPSSFGHPVKHLPWLFGPYLPGASERCVFLSGPRDAESNVFAPWLWLFFVCRLGLDNRTLIHASAE